MSSWSDDDKTCYGTALEIVDRAARYIEARDRGEKTFGGRKHAALPEADRRRVQAELLPWLRGRLSAARRLVGTVQDDDRMLRFVGSHDGPRLAALGTSCPDHFLRTKIRPLFADWDPASGDIEALKAALARGLDQYRKDYQAYYERCRRPESPGIRDPSPTVVLVPGLGMFAFGKNKSESRVTAEFYNCAIEVMRGAEAIDRYEAMDEQEAFDIEYWPLEEAKLQRLPKPKELEGRIALITGGAGGIGGAIARRLLTDGACVVLTDIDPAALQQAVNELGQSHGADRVRGIQGDVTSEASVRTWYAFAAREFGGLDVLVSNAGIAHSSPVARLELGEWERSFAVNSTGHFIVAREAMRLLIAQGLGGALVFVATKNVMSPGKDFAAYSAAKAAEAQLAKVLALEGAAYGIRSNIVNPDAVFQDSKLWSDEIRRERAAAQGIRVDQVEDFYRKRNLLGVSILPEDVAESVLFFAADHSAKTTGCTLTVDGGVKDAFPR